MAVDKSESEHSFGDRPVDFSVVLSVGGFGRITVDFSVDILVDSFSVDISVDISVALSVDRSVRVSVDRFRTGLADRRKLWAREQCKVRYRYVRSRM